MERQINKRIRLVDSLEDMQKIYEIASKWTTILKIDEAYSFRKYRCSVRKASYITDTDRYYTITTMYVKDIVNKDGSVDYIDVCDHFITEKYVCTWKFDKTGATKNQVSTTTVGKIWRRVYKPYDIVKEQKDFFKRDPKGKIVASAKPIIGYNKKYDMTEHNVVAYDLNSAYAAALMDKIIDTYNMDYARVVGKNEVGFLMNDDLTLVEEGEYADYVFPLMESPYKAFAKKYYEQKKKAPKGSKERDLAKQILVITVGQWQNHNPFLRAFVVNRCNNFIKYFVNKYKDKVCLWNTDAVYCTEHIPELDALLGDDIGQFKVEYEGIFRQKGFNYQKGTETSYRGVMKCLFKEDYNILTDPIPVCNIPYRMNKETLMIENNDEFVEIIEDEKEL